jgi:integrase
VSRLYESADSFVARKNSDHTKKIYHRALRRFGQMKYGELPDDQIFKELNSYMKKATMQTVIDDLYFFKDYLDKKKFAIRTKRLELASLQSWFSNNNLTIPKSKSKELRGPIKPTTDDKAFTHDTARRAFDQMKSPVSRCLFLFLLSTGCRLGEAMQVKLSDVDWNVSPVTVTLDETITKTGERRQVFLTTEAASYIQSVWLTPSEENGKTMNNRERYIVAADHKAQHLISKGLSHERPPMESDDRLWPLSQSTARKFLTTATVRAGFNERTKAGIRKLHPHSTRKFFRTFFGIAAGSDAAETLLGHSPGLTSFYRRLETPEIVKIWKEHEIALHITISPEARQAMQTRDFNSTEIIKLQKENTELKKEFGNFKENLDKVLMGLLHKDLVIHEGINREGSPTLFIKANPEKGKELVFDKDGDGLPIISLTANSKKPE